MSKLIVSDTSKKEKEKRVCCIYKQRVEENKKIALK